MSAIIELHHLSKHFGPFRALDDVSLQVGAGITGLLGPNGAGKSTLIKILLGLLPPSSGSGKVLGFEIGRNARKIRANVGYMPEDDCFLYGLTGIESVQLSARLSGLPTVEGLRRAHEILDYCGVGQERYRAVETYSTGMRQKLRFAQSLVHDPTLLVLDEPTSGLDPEERDIMLRRIQRLSSDHGKTVLICTHILPDVQAVSESVVILANGRVQVSDRLDHLSRPSEPSVRVRVSGSAARFIERLTKSGLGAEHAENGAITVHGPENELNDRVWRIARDLGFTVRSLAPSRNSLEQIFLDAIQEQPHGSP
jgi:ABC-2 type transport system ATP-binding protein